MNRNYSNCEPKFFLSVLLCITAFLIPIHSIAIDAVDPPESEESIILTDAKGSDYRIVLPVSPTASEKRAAEVLQKYLLEISGAALPIVSSDVRPTDKEIILGQNERLNDIDPEIFQKDLKQDGFAIYTLDERLIISGGTGKGTLYGVYTFLEEHLGARMYTPDAKVIPEMERIVLGKIDNVQIPKVRARYVHYNSAWDAEYTDWHKLSHNPGVDCRIGGCLCILSTIWFRPGNTTTSIRNITLWLTVNESQHNSVLPTITYSRLPFETFGVRSVGNSDSHAISVCAGNSVAVTKPIRIIVVIRV